MLLNGSIKADYSIKGSPPVAKTIVRELVCVCASAVYKSLDEAILLIMLCPP